METHFIYVIQESHPKGRGAVKIGYSRRPGSRLSELQIGNWRELKIIMSCGPMSQAMAIGFERDFHRYAAKQRIRGEWFKHKAVFKTMNIARAVLPESTVLTQTEAGKGFQNKPYR